MKVQWCIYEGSLLGCWKQYEALNVRVAVYSARIPSFLQGQPLGSPLSTLTCQLLPLLFLFFFFFLSLLCLEPASIFLQWFHICTAKMVQQFSVEQHFTAVDTKLCTEMQKGSTQASVEKVWRSLLFKNKDKKALFYLRHPFRAKHQVIMGRKFSVYAFEDIATFWSTL